MKAILRVLGALLLLCGAAPLFYGIFNIGTAALCVLGVFFLVLPYLWRHLSAFPRLRVVFATGLGLFFVYSVTVSGMMAYKAWFDRPAPAGPATLVILGAKVNEDGPSLMLRRRLDKAYDYMAHNSEAICVVTGGQGADEPVAEAAAMADYLENRGIDPERILREDKSTSTRQNFAFAAALPGLEGRETQPVVVVTDSFHQLRASLFAKAAFPQAREYHGISSLTPWGLMPSYWIRDMFGVLVALVQTKL